MNDDADWMNLDAEEAALLSEGFCPWGGSKNPCTPTRVVVDRNGESATYSYCFLSEALVRIIAGKPEVLPMEEIVENGWRVTECQV